MISLIEAAVEYARRRWQVIPLHDVTQGSCSCPKGGACGKDSGKHPRFTAWQESGSTDAAQIRRWWERWPHANIGLVTGAASRLTVLDIDPRNGGDEALRELERCYAPLPETPMVLTGGGGQHYYFACAEALASCKLAPGIDFQASGGRQVVAPPSLHASGRCYVWEVCHDLTDVPLAPVPDWLRALVEDKAGGAQAPTTVLPEVLPAVAMHDLKVSARIKYLIRLGEDPHQPSRYPSRSEALFAVIQAMIQAGHDDGTIAAVVLDPTNAISHKPLTQKSERNPRYRAQTRDWIAKEIARARGKPRQGLSRSATPAVHFIDPWLGPRNQWHGVPLACEIVEEGP